ncbi:tonB-system energizer ExbB [Beijerinckiaceae bacterium]|nr:tonB-system energizer ExbB [Beijerinckiaceae bacterium]
MISNKNEFRQEPRPLRSRIATLFSAAALCAILGNAAALAQTSAAPQVAAPPMLDAAVPTPEPASPAQASPVQSEPGPIAQPATAPEPVMEETRHLPRANGLPPSILPQDLSPWGMFLNAVLTVKIVMVGLAIASLVTWTVMFAKIVELWYAKRSARRGLEILAHAPSLHRAEKEFGQTKSPVGRLVAAAVGEADRSEGLASEGIKDRAATLLSRIEAQGARAISREMGILATIGAVAPFVGLFGTVWGIMDSFIGISKSNTTNLAVVAPGIAEALLATAMGLLAAIPAVVLYNAFARAITGYRAQLGDAAAEVLRHLSRDLDREALPQHEGAPVVPMRQSAE